MRKFAADDDFSFLKGCTLSSVHIGRYQVDFLFEEGCRVLLEYGLEYFRPSDEKNYPYDIQAGYGAVWFHEPLQKKIANVRTDETSVELLFEGGARIRILTEDGPFESGQISGPGGYGILF